MATSYSNIQSNAQTQVYNLLTAASLNATIVDGVPKQLLKGVGFPYIIVRTPEPSDDNLVFTNTLFETAVPLDIEIWSEQESVVRTLADSVRNTIKTNVSTLHGENLYNFRIMSSSINPFAISENKTAHRMVIRVTFTWGG